MIIEVKNNNSTNILPSNLLLDTAVLLLVFNRLDSTKQVFEAIKKAKPPRLYIASDGARSDNYDEARKVQAVRDYVLKGINWDCEVRTLLWDQNLGCKYAVSNAITWFFEHEEQGIILEDDCLPSQSFFLFCEKMLNLFKDDERIMMITGTNYLVDIQEKVQKDYFFSRHFSVWGWATWNRAWKTYDPELDDFHSLIENEKDYSYLFLRKNEAIYYQTLMNHIVEKNIDTWDFQWVFNCIYNYGLCITPSKNLISNIGVDGTHSNGITENNFLKLHEINVIDYEKPRWVLPNQFYDSKVSRRNFGVVHNPLILYSKKIIRCLRVLKKG